MAAKVKQAMQQEQRVLRALVMMSWATSPGSRLFARAAEWLLPTSRAGELNLEIGKALAADTATEAGDSGQRDIRLFRQLR